MAAARARISMTSLGRLAAATALVALCGCGSVSDPAGFSIATQDRYDFMTCKEITAARDAQRNRLKQLSELMEKADASPGGFIVSAAAYRSEFVQTRALQAAAERAAQMHNCDPAKKQ